jgi:hypothetical protein
VITAVERAPTKEAAAPEQKRAQRGYTGPRRSILMNPLSAIPSFPSNCSSVELLKI